MRRMGRLLSGLVPLVLIAGVLTLAYAVGAPMSMILGAGAGVLSLLWLLLLLTVPWNLYFRAHSVLAEIAVSREKGLTVSQARDVEAARIARVMLRVALGGHVVSAGLVLAVTVATGNATGYWFAAFFLLSTVFRPAAAYFAQLRQRLSTLLKDVTFPRDDVAELCKEVAGLREYADDVQRGSEVLEEKAEEQYQALAQLRSTVDALGVSVVARAEDADRKIVALGREFEAAVNRLTDNEEIITGVKAFLRLLRTADATDGPA